ncbi:MAG: hypothetical protein LBL59_03245 [Xanthomonadaceae bacterium]|jgi:uncharacterized protein YeaO (DUF488 family)|nr:hypothetical protein [Xanthomonadaceae bacterium]
MNPARVQRSYSDPRRKSEHRVLIDRLWPRGIGKNKAVLDEWMKVVSVIAQARLREPVRAFCGTHRAACSHPQDERRG